METDALIICGGAAGIRIARDLSMRGINCILVEQYELNAGATELIAVCCTVARYVAKDP